MSSHIAAARHALESVLDALDTASALLDDAGIVVATNRVWREARGPVGLYGRRFPVGLL